MTDSRFSFVERFDRRWIIGNYVFGVLFVPLGYAVARFIAKRFHGHRWWNDVLDDISGHSLKRARDEMDQWARLQREWPAGAGAGKSLRD